MKGYEEIYCYRIFKLIVINSKKSAYLKGKKSAGEGLELKIYRGKV